MAKALLYVLVGAGALYFYNQSEVNRKRKYLENLKPDDSFWMEVMKRLTNNEINVMYDFMVNYSDSKPVPEGSALQQQLIEISSKYNIFT